jgi:hypothetical protein
MAVDYSGQPWQKAKWKRSLLFLPLAVREWVDRAASEGKSVFDAVVLP